ncbi:MAG: hypothetical protein LBD67_09710 [Candidatus Accumulibacter sp.]|nr:hypothetical protein [Accumulibacter sp.]
MSLSKHRQRLFPFVLSLSKYERTLRLSSPYPSTRIFRQAQDGAGRTDWKDGSRLLTLEPTTCICFHRMSQRDEPGIFASVFQYLKIRTAGCGG